VKNIVVVAAVVATFLNLNLPMQASISHAHSKEHTAALMPQM
jgi:hypothetical protein